MNPLQRRMSNYSVGYCNFMIECGLQEETESKKDPSVNVQKTDCTDEKHNTDESSDLASLLCDNNRVDCEFGSQSISPLSELESLRISPLTIPATEGVRAYP
jgi:hypothetical protein